MHEHTCHELLHNPLYIFFLLMWASCPRQTTHKLFLCDDTTLKPVVVFEELCGPDAALVHHVSDLANI